MQSNEEGVMEYLINAIFVLIGIGIIVRIILSPWIGECKRKLKEAGHNELE